MLLLNLFYYYTEICKETFKINQKLLPKTKIFIITCQTKDLNYKELAY